jgi:hypothetical protein
MGKENACANQAQKRCNCLNHRKDPCAPGPDRTTCDLAQSKGFLTPNRNSDLTDALIQQIWELQGEPGADCRRRPDFLNAVNRRAAPATFDSPPGG